MIDGIASPALLSSTLQLLLSETPWNIVVTTREGQILATSRALRDLLGSADADIAGVALDALLPEAERAAARALFQQLELGEPPAPLRVHLHFPGRVPLSAEIELHPIHDDPAKRVTVVIYPISILHRRERILLEFNRIAPQLIAAQSPQELYQRASAALEPLGMGLLVAMLEPGQQTLRITYQSTRPGMLAMVERFTRVDVSQVRLPRTAPCVHEALTQREALFIESFEPLLGAVLSPRASMMLRAILQLTGLPGCIMAPLLAGSAELGVLLVWSHVLTREQVPFIESFAHQLTAVLGQIELRSQMQQQMQRLNSLATTAQAVTTLGSLGDVLNVVCVQAQELLGAEFARIAAPSGEPTMLKYIVSTGLEVGTLFDMPIPIDNSISGGVFRSGQGRMIENFSQSPDAYPPFRQRSDARSVLYHPLRHGGVVLGVLIVGHREVGYFTHADLEYLARYAEYAAVAIANARLHSALKQSEAEQQRQRAELEVLFAFAQAINVSLDIDTVLAEGLRAIEALGLATISVALLYEGERARASAKAWRGLPPELVPALGRVLSDPAFGREQHSEHVQAPNQAMQRELLRIEPRLGALLPLEMRVIPLLAGGKPLGAISINRPASQPFSDRELQLLQAIAGQLGQAAAKAQAHEALGAAAADNARLYREAEAVRSYLNTLVSKTPDVLLTIRPDKTIRLLNPERLIWPLPEIHDRPITFLDLAPEHAHAELLRRWELLQRNIPQSFELELTDTAGHQMNILLSAVLIADYGEVFVIVKDVTEQRQREAHQQQTEKLAALGRMVAGAAHELNNPLAAILGLAQLHLVDIVGGELRDDLEKVERAALRARAIVQQLLTFAQPQPPQTEAVPIAGLLHEALERIGPTVAASAIEVALSLPDDLPPASGDPHQLAQVLFNILHNAAQSLGASPAGQPRLLRIGASADASDLLLTIEDSGPGIEPQHLSHIFEPFFTTRAVGQGTGLGLAISHAIIQQHGGQIWASSQVGKGALFSIRLPICKGGEQPAQAPAAPSPGLAGARILLVEDEELLRFVVSQALARHAFVVDAVGSGAEALEQALGNEYQLVITDLRMPGIDGPTLYSRLQPQRPELRWMILTGDTMSERSQRFLARTGLPTLAKPFTHDQLLAQVIGCLQT